MRLSLRAIFLAGLFAVAFISACSHLSGSRQIASETKLQNPVNTGNDVVYPWPFTKTLIGTSHAAPLYDPNGLLAEHVLSHGALDARQMGFSVLKIWLGPEIFGQLFYRFDSDLIQKKPSFDQMLNVSEYQKTLALPFDVVVLEYDSEHIWANVSNRKLTDDDLKTIAQQTYDLASTLLRTYAGTGRVFVIQNHEGDNHLADFGNAQNKLPDPNYVQPTSNSYDNYMRYFLTRQSAIRRARKEAGANGVAIYQMCEVNAVLRVYRPELLKDRTKQAEAVGQKLVKTSLTTEVLPHLDCDLYGYSSYDTSLNPDGKLLAQAVEFIRQHTSPSVAFGRNNVAISEAGIPEQDAGFRKQVPSYIQNTRQWIQNLHLPMYLVWNLYDNECAIGVCKEEGKVYKNIDMKQARGFWMRDVSGRDSETFKGIQDLVEAQVSIEEVPRWVYNLLLSRDPSSEELKSGIASIQAHGREAYYLAISASEEARAKVVQDVFQKTLHKNPSSEQIQFWSSFIKGLPLASAANLLILQGAGLDDIKAKPVLPVEYDPTLSSSQRNRLKMIQAFYDKLLNRKPSPKELDDANKSRLSCTEMAKSLASGDDFQKRTGTMDNLSYIQLLYRSLLLREGEPGGVAGWKQTLDSGKMNRVQAAQGFADSEEMKARCQSVYEVP